jgi:hypothetical protein
MSLTAASPLATPCHRSTLTADEAELAAAVREALTRAHLSVAGPGEGFVIRPVPGPATPVRVMLSWRAAVSPGPAAAAPRDWLRQCQAALQRGGFRTYQLTWGDGLQLVAFPGRA